MIRFGGPAFVRQDTAGGMGEGRGPKVQDPYEIAAWLRGRGYRAGYAPQASLKDTAHIRDIRKAFREADIMIAEVGYWENLIDTDETARSKNRNCMLDAMALAEELGARCAVDILGSYVHGHGSSAHTARNFSDDAFAEAVDLARYYIDMVKPRTASFAFEIFPFSAIDSPEMLEKLVRAVDRKQFGVHLDLVNLINCPRAYWNSAEIVRDCARRFGDRIVAPHVKDIKMKEPAVSVILEEVPAGQGMIDFGAYAKVLHGLPQEIPFMMEHLSGEDQYDQAAAHIRMKVREAGIEI